MPTCSFSYKCTMAALCARCPRVLSSSEKSLNVGETFYKFTFDAINHVLFIYVNHTAQTVHTYVQPLILTSHNFSPRTARWLHVQLWKPLLWLVNANLLLQIIASRAREQALGRHNKRAYFLLVWLSSQRSRIFWVIMRFGYISSSDTQLHSTILIRIEVRNATIQRPVATHFECSVAHINSSEIVRAGNVCTMIHSTKNKRLNWRRESSLCRRIKVLQIPHASCTYLNSYGSTLKTDRK